MPQTREHILLARQVGCRTWLGVHEQADMVDDKELLELWRWRYGAADLVQVPGRNPDHHRVRLKALEGDKSELGCPRW